MKKEKCWKSLHGCLCAAVLALFTFGFTSCKDDDLKGGFDPSKPIVVTVLCRRKLAMVTT